MIKRTDTASTHLQSVPLVTGKPLVGVLPDLMTGDPYEYLKNVMLEHGDLVGLKVGPQTIYLASHPDYLQHILRDNYENYVKPSMFYSGVQRVLGNGLVTSSGEFWLRQRRMIQPHLHRKQLGRIFSDMVEAISETIDGWDDAAYRGEELDFGEAMSRITLNVIMRTMMGKDLLTQDEIESSIHEMSTIIKFVGTSQFLGFLPQWVPLPDQRTFDRDLASFKAKVSKIIAECRLNKTESAGLIQMLLNTVDEVTNEQMTEDQLFDEVITIFAAGYETTATSLMWLWTLLDQHPEVLEKLQTEIDTVLGDRLPTIEDVHRLSYARQVFMETLRLRTVAPFLPRMLKMADQLGNYELPAGATVLVFYHGVHHNPKVWNEPEMFNPDRFAQSQSADRHPFAYVPFSAGPRKCAGDELAMMEGPLALSMMLQRYQVKVAPGQEFSGKLGATMRPRNGLKASLHHRALPLIMYTDEALAAD